MRFAPKSTFQLLRGVRIDPTVSIFVVSLICGVLTTLFSNEPFEQTVFIAVTLLVGAWTGTAEPQASVGQIRRGWVAGGICTFLFFVAPLFAEGPGAPYLMASNRVLEVSAYTLWMLFAVPAIGIVSAFAARRFRSGTNWSDKVFSVASGVAICASPFLLTQLAPSVLK